MTLFIALPKLRTRHSCPSVSFHASQEYSHNLSSVPISAYVNKRVKPLLMMLKVILYYHEVLSLWIILSIDRRWWFQGFSKWLPALSNIHGTYVNLLVLENHIKRMKYWRFGLKSARKHIEHSCNWMHNSFATNTPRIIRIGHVRETPQEAETLSFCSVLPRLFCLEIFYIHRMNSFSDAVSNLLNRWLHIDGNRYLLLFRRLQVCKLAVKKGLWHKMTFT